MATTLRDVMTAEPLCLSPDATVAEAARMMRDSDVGDVIVADGATITGIVTDRDIVVRAIAQQGDPSQMTVREIASTDLVTLAPDDSIDRAVEVMRQRALRRLPVVEGGRPVGVVSIGDLAMERDEQSALADISAAPGNT